MIRLATLSAALVAALAVLPASAHATIAYPSQRPAEAVVHEVVFLATAWAYSTAPAALKPCPNGVEQWTAADADLVGSDGAAWGRGWHADDGSQCALWVSESLAHQAVGDDQYLQMGDEFVDACVAVAHEWLHARGIPHHPVGVPDEMARVMTPLARPGSSAPAFCLAWAYQREVALLRARHVELRANLADYLPLYLTVYARRSIAGARAILDRRDCKRVAGVVVSCPRRSARAAHSRRRGR